INAEFKWYESVNSLNISVPLNLTKGRFYRSIIPKVGWDQIQVFKTDETPDTFYTGNISALSFGLEAYNLIKLSDRDIASRWGQIFLFTYKTSLINNPTGDLIAFQTAFLFPGLFKHHVLKLGYGYQKVTENEYRFNSVIDYPRGIKSYSDNSINRYSIDYKFPFWYPDFRIGSIIYFKRFRNNFFFDYGAATDKNDQPVYYETAGLELTSDFHVFRSIIPFLAGVRYINNLNENYSSSFEFLFAVNFDSF
ncbi:MAG: hypothetical protein NT033_00700, partial [Candidatus Omnitrophica bacterium]|nr:hypothetical protein [Candidatus Omnitrophota bacterium]